MIPARRSHRARSIDPSCARATAVALCVAAALDAGAQQAPAATPALDEIVVTSTKLGKSITELTQSVSIVTEQEIAIKAYSDFTEVLRNQAGIEFKQAGGPGQFSYPKMRGFGTSDILVVIDGVKINEPSSGGVGNLLGQIDPASIERVEILRGPQAVLYGANSTAGVISITTKSGNSSGANFGLEAGSLDWRRANASYRGTSEVGDGDLAYSVNVSKIDSNGVHPEEYTRDETVQAKLSYERDRIGMGVNVWRTDNEFQYAELDEAFCCQTPATWWAFQTPDPVQYSGTENSIVGAYFRHDFNDVWSQRVTLGAMSKSFDTVDGADGLLGYRPAPFDNFAFGGATYARGAPVPIYDGTTSIAAFSRNDNDQLDYNIIMNGDRIGALFGFELQEQNAHQWGSYGTSDNDESIRSFYANSEFDLGERVVLALGMRSDDFDSWGRENTGNVGISIELGAATSLYSNFGTSFTAPTMSQLFNPTYGVSTLQPQSGETAELGIRHIVGDGKLELEGTFWNTDVDNVIAYDGSIPNPRAPSGAGQYTNRDRMRTQGLELTWRYRFAEALALTGNYTYTESESKALGGWIRTVQIAKNKGNLGIDMSRDKFFFGANAYYAGPRLRWAGDVENPAYWRVDVTGRLNFTESISVFVRVENLFDEDIVEDLGYLQPGRYSVIGMQYKFF